MHSFILMGLIYLMEMYAMNGLMQPILRKTILLQIVQVIFVDYYSNCCLNTTCFTGVMFPLNANTF